MSYSRNISYNDLLDLLSKYPVTKYLDETEMIRPFNKELWFANPNKNKILSYLIQAYETYYNTITLQRVLKMLYGRKTKIVLYTYDSILLDVAKEDIKLLPKIKQELEADGFPTRMSIGENYGALIKK